MDAPKCSRDWGEADPDPLYEVARFFARSASLSSRRLAAQREQLERLLRRLDAAGGDLETTTAIRQAVAALALETCNLAATVGAETARRLDLDKAYERVVMETGLTDCIDLIASPERRRHGAPSVAEAETLK